MPITGVSHITAGTHDQQDTELQIAGPIRVDMLKTDDSRPSRAEVTLYPNSSKEVKFVKRPKWFFTEKGPKVVAYMPSIQRRKAK
jgi:hypothetical protein